jgi:hypothetical protein
MNLGWIRMFMGERRDVYNLDGYYKFRAANYGPYWYVDAESPDLYIASNRPHVKRVDFHSVHYGWYPEDRTLGQTEEAWCHSYKDIRRRHGKWSGLPWVAVPMFGLQLDQWQHVGDSWQDKGL